jgi:group I intron endonuclease
MTVINTDNLNQSGIYQIRNIKNDKIYIGSTINFKNRFYQHIRELNKGIHHSAKLQKSWNIHSQDNFVFEVLEIANNLDRESLYELEQKYLDEFKPYEMGFNINPVVNEIIDNRTYQNRQLYNAIQLEKDNCLSRLKHHVMIESVFQFKEREPKNTTIYVYKKLIKLYSIYPSFLKAVIDHIIPEYQDTIKNKLKVIGWTIYNKEMYNLRFLIQGKTIDNNDLYYAIGYDILDQIKNENNFNNYYDVFTYTFKLDNIHGIHIFKK